MLKEISQAKETLIFLLQNLGFVINFKKSQLTPVKEIEFLGLVINSVNMTLALPEEKVLDIQNKCAQLIASPKTTIMELTKLLGKLSFTAQALLPGRIQCRYLQQQQIQAVREANSYQAKVKLNQQSLAELKWWKENLLLQNGKPLKIGIPQLIIQTDASKTGWRAVCQGITTGGTWSYQERTKHINILELIAVKLPILTFTKGKSVTVIHLQIGNMTALSYLVKMGRTCSPKLLQVAKETWDYLLVNVVAVTAEYFPSSLNIQADWQSRNHRDSSDWKSNPKIFSQIAKIRGIPQIDLFASRLNHQLPKHMSWHPDPGSCSVDSFQHSWRNLSGYAFPPIFLIGKVFAKVRKDQSLFLIVTPAWQTQPWYATLLAMSVQNPIILPNLITLLQGPQGQ